MLSRIFGKKIDNVRVVPISLKIIIIFTVILLISNFSTHYISLIMNRGELDKYINRLLIRDLKDLHVFLTNQHDIFLYTDDEDKSYKAIEDSARWNLKNTNSMAIGWHTEKDFVFYVQESGSLTANDKVLLKERFQNIQKTGRQEGPIQIELESGSYFGAFKYNQLWDIYAFRAEDINELYFTSRQNFLYISLIIVIFSIICMGVGIYILRHILRFVSHISNNIMRMEQSQELTLIDMDGAVNDDIAYLGMAFNSLSSTINNLMTIFKKFVARDIAQRAYKEREIRLEGKKRYLTVLFTDIKRFTYMTETLGTDIIKLLNIHYDQAIRYIHDCNGDIGSIIGDALLAIFGGFEEYEGNKSLQAVEAGYRILEVAEQLRVKMREQEQKILSDEGKLTAAQQKVLDAVLLEVGVGIDGGEVFYGNIGSNERMVNTVIGDNVNSSSRLEGLTRVYNVPIITSEYVKNEIMETTDDYFFLELDRVLVKGKTEGKLIFWPFKISEITMEMRDHIDNYLMGLNHYYNGEWDKAHKLFKNNLIPASEVFLIRTSQHKLPVNWSGIWTMESK